MTNVEFMDYTHSHPSTVASLSSTAQLSPVPCMNSPFTFLKTATIPTYYGISIAILRYISMQLTIVSFTMTRFIIVIIALRDHVVDIVFVAKPAFITFSYMSLLIHCTSRYTVGGIHIESYFVLSIEL